MTLGPQALERAVDHNDDDDDGGGDFTLPDNWKLK